MSSSSASRVMTPDMTAYSNGYKTAFTELPCSLSSPTQGVLPPDLVGTYYRCGPAMFSAGSLPPPKNSLVKPKTPPVADGVDTARMVQHPFEGDGAVLAITFHGGHSSSSSDTGLNTAGKMTTRFRYVRTNAFTNERKRGKKLYTGMDSTRSTVRRTTSNSNMVTVNDRQIGNDISTPPFYRHHLLPGLNKLRKNTSNTRAIYFGKRLLTLWSGGLPYKLDALALSTEGRSQLGGVVKREDQSLGANAVVDSHKNRILFYSIDEESSSTTSTLTLYEFNSKFEPIRNNDGIVKVRLPGLALIYDFAITDNYALFVQPIVKVNGMQYLLSKEPGKCLSLESQSSLLHIVTRAGGGKGQAAGGTIQTFPIPYDGCPDVNLQFINAYEDETDGTIVFDAIRSTTTNEQEGGGGGGGSSSSAATPSPSWPWTTTLSAFRSMSAKKSMWRYIVQPRTGVVTKECITNDQVYFGTVNRYMIGQKHRYVYTATGCLGKDIAPPQGITKFDLLSNTNNRSSSGCSWFPEAYEFCGEPMYAPRVGGGEDDDDTEEEDSGYILSVLFNGRDETSELIVLVANDLQSGPIARVPLGMAIPHGYHGCFVPSTTAENWSYEEIERRAKLFDKMETRGSMWNEVKSDFSGLGLRFDDMEEYFGDLM